MNTQCTAFLAILQVILVEYILYKSFLMNIDCNMKRKLLLMVAIAFPWVILLMDDNPLGAVFAIILQATLIGWIPASMWALRIVPTLPAFKIHKKNEEKTTSEIKRK